MSDRILVTGGAGFIGSHTCKLLRSRGYEPVTFDNLSTGHEDAVRFGPFVRGDILEKSDLDRAFKEWQPTAIIHFAAFTNVGESVSSPGLYFRNNVVGLLTLLDAAVKAGVMKVVFSSSCATYGIPDNLPIRELSLQRPVNPYGETKLAGEWLLRDYDVSAGMKHVALRYFNACGADAEGELSERHDPETHLIPRALMAASGLISHLDLFGDDYPTPDGTCIRDYIHVEDLAEAHVRALEYLKTGSPSLGVNVGTGKGTSVSEILGSIARVTGKRVPVKITPRRAGDPPALYADIGLAREKLGFAALRSDIDNIVLTAMRSFGFSP